MTREYLEDTLKLEETESRSQEVKKHSHEIDHNDTTYNTNTNNTKYISPIGVKCKIRVKGKEVKKHK